MPLFFPKGGSIVGIEIELCAIASRVQKYQFLCSIAINRLQLTSFEAPALEPHIYSKLFFSADFAET